MSDREYATELRTQAARVLEAHPTLPHRWQARDELCFPSVAEQGFDVIVRPEPDGITVLTSVGFHEHFDGAPASAVGDALGFTRDLLSPHMRVRERRSGTRPYRWCVERRDSDEWCVVAETGLLLWNYLGRRSERVHQNCQLPGRLEQRGSISSNHGHGAG